MLILDHLVQSIRKAVVHNIDVQASPACILWPDKDRQWQAAIPQLQSVLPELNVLADYDPDRRSGPAIWLRCVVADRGTEDTASVIDGAIPILYLPGFSRQDLRAVETCPESIKLLAELQYRGVIWSQINAKDWTILAYLKSDQGGLNLDVALDNDTKRAMQLALTRLLEEDVERLRDQHLDASYFNGLLADDPIRSMLQWLDRGDGYRDELNEPTWQAFVQLSNTQLAFDPENDGILAGAERLARRQGPWKNVWDRFCEAPHLYPNLPDQIRKCAMPQTDLFAGADEYGGWPQWNDVREDELRTNLVALTNLPRHEAQQRVLELENRHGERRSLIWAALDAAPLACALEYLAAIARAQPLAGGTVDDVANAYRTSGWQVDAALLCALAATTHTEDIAAVKAALTALYLPWAQDAARHLQSEVARTVYPGGTIENAPEFDYPSGVCLLFVDGLRLDLANQLADRLKAAGRTVDHSVHWAALTSVTATAKPAITPVRNEIDGQEANADFEPSVAETNRSLKGGQALKKLLVDAGWQVLDRSDVGDPTGKAWCEAGNIDNEGHHRGWKLARHVPVLLEEIVERVHMLLEAGWQTVHIITDHGWLLFPGGLPKVDLPAVLAENKWGTMCRHQGERPDGRTSLPLVLEQHTTVCTGRRHQLLPGRHGVCPRWSQPSGMLDLRTCDHLRYVSRN